MYINILWSNILFYFCRFTLKQDVIWLARSFGVKEKERERESERENYHFHLRREYSLLSKIKRNKKIKKYIYRHSAQRKRIDKRTCRERFKDTPL